MQDTLQKTKYCNFDHPDIHKIANSLKAGDDDPVTIAARTFYFVRDNISFGFDLFQTSASDTLKRGYGACWNKSILLTALLRCNKINALFGSIPLKRNFIQPVIGWLYLLANTPYNHCLVNAYVNNSWTILDPVLDKKTYETFFLPRGVEWGIDWNDEDDVNLYTESVQGPPIMHTDIDNAINKRVGNSELPRPIAIIGNKFINKYIRKKIDSTNLNLEESNR